MVEPSTSFLSLVATLLHALPPTLPIPDTLLLQLHAIFGPMLLSALQLVDKREVVRVSLPSDRHVYQVSSSSGKNYTIHLNPPSPNPITPMNIPIIPKLPEIPYTTSDSQAESIPRTPSPPPSQAFNQLLASPSDTNPNVNDNWNIRNTPSPTLLKSETKSIVNLDQKDVENSLKRERIIELANNLKSMYCPCAGWSYGCLAGEKNIMCKHILAIIIAHKTNRDIKAEIGVGGVAGLLGLS
ncbi:uncharacterized protein L201_006204 [Kwoniella dendrophila CBS 6074]|uniref:SWIM-type domain-containing protein n=1 Tax=Kwoniella dendrophila CBS 6074 TaxID=1295534 RepID=A0AAX4K0L2_9TREE